MKLRTGAVPGRWWIAPIFCLLGALSVSGFAAEGSGEAALSEKDMMRGKLLFLQCSACHALTPGDNGGKIGPSLAGVFGRTAGSASFYDGYSEALRGEDYVWDRETMDTWLTGPAAMAPGTSMVFTGIVDEGQRRQLLRYLEVVTRAETE